MVRVYVDSHKKTNILAPQYHGVKKSLATSHPESQTTKIH